MLALARGFPVFIFTGIVLLGCTGDREPQKDAIVVRVNRDCELTSGQLGERLARHLRDFGPLTARNEDMVSSAKDTIINEFVVDCLVATWAKENGVFVRKEQLDAEVGVIRSQYPDELAFRQSLIEADLTFDQWLKLSERKLLEKLVMEKIRSKTTDPKEEDQRAYYEKNLARFERPAQMRVSQILLKTEDQARLIDAELKSGKDFAQLARKYSISPDGPNGGDLGWVSRDTHEIFESVNRLALGQRTKLVKTPFGYHILKLVARRPGRRATFAEVQPQIVRDLKAKKEQQVYSAWLEAEILRAQVYKNEDLIKSIKVFSRRRS